MRVPRRVWSKVRVYSCADGTMRIEPKWRKEFAKPGVFTRMYLAERLQTAMNRALKKC
jgi:hypothetical protein